MMKKLLSVVCCITLAVTMLTACGSGSGENAGNTSGSNYPKMTLVCAGLDRADTAKAHDLEIFMNLVTKKSGGQITFKKYWNASLGKAPTNLDIIRNGIADVGTVCTLYTPSQLPLSQITYCVPFAPDDPALAAQLMYEVAEKHPEFYREYEKNNVVNVAWKGNEPYKLYSKDPITSIDQLKGTKITMGGVYYIPWFQSIGTVPVTAAASELYQTVKTGVAKGSFVYDSIFCDFKLYEVMKYDYRISLGARNCDTICFNKDRWDSFDKKTQKLMRDCATEAMGEFQDWQDKEMVGWEKEMKTNGVKFTDITSSDKRKFAKKALDYNDTLESWINDANAAGYNGKQIMSDYLKGGEKLGYKWSFDTSKYIIDK